MTAAFDPANHQGPLPSPCISRCVMDPQTGWCEGCRRTIKEIIDWSSASEAQKRTVWISLERRGSTQ